MPGAPPHPPVSAPVRRPLNPPTSVRPEPPLRLLPGGAEDSSPRAALRAAASRRGARPPLRVLRSEAGQASVELTVLLPLIVAIVAVAWQAVLAGQAVWEVRVAARAAARANAFGADAAAAARAHLPRGLEHGLRVRTSEDGEVRVSLRVPTVLPSVHVGRISATSHFRPQGG